MDQLIDQTTLEYCSNLEGILAIKAILGFIMFGVALELTINDFRLVKESPKGPIVGLLSQVLVLPVLTIILIHIMRPPATVALGMILVAACPGGSVSNFLGVVARANAALQVTLSALTTATGLIFTPLNFWLYGSMYEPSAKMLQKINVPPSDVALEIFVILGTPLAIGMLIRHFLPQIAEKITRPIKTASIIIFAGLVLGAVIKEQETIQKFGIAIIAIVSIHNALGFIGGYWFARLMRLPERDCRSVSIETGIQNSGLGLGLICSYFAGAGGMAMIAAAWGVWHLIAGGTIAFYWSRKPVPH